MKPSHSEFVPIRGRRYHLRIWGPEAAPKVFMLHGWMDVSATFQFLVDALQREWRVIAPDWRGFGLSSRNADVYWFPDYLGDLDAILDLCSGAEPVRLVGHSMGGNVACLYAGVRPERVAKVATVEGIGLSPMQPDAAPARYGKWLEQLREPPAFGTYATRADLAARLQRDNPRLRPERAEFLAQHLAVNAHGGRFAMAGDPFHRVVNPVLYRLEEARACWRRVRAPVLWIMGRESTILRRLNIEDHQGRLACFANAREVIVDDAGHNLHHDQPERLAEVLEAFV